MFTSPAQKKTAQEHIFERQNNALHFMGSTENPLGLARGRTLMQEVVNRVFTHNSVMRMVSLQPMLEPQSLSFFLTQKLIEDAPGQIPEVELALHSLPMVSVQERFALQNRVHTTDGDEQIIDSVSNGMREFYERKIIQGLTAKAGLVITTKRSTLPEVLMQTSVNVFKMANRLLSYAVAHPSTGVDLSFSAGRYKLGYSTQMPKNTILLTNMGEQFVSCPAIFAPYVPVTKFLYNMRRVEGNGPRAGSFSGGITRYKFDVVQPDGIVLINLIPEE